MPPKKSKSLPAQGTSDPQGPAGVGGTVPAPPPSSSDDGLSSVSRVGTGEERTTTPKGRKEKLSPSVTPAKAFSWLMESLDELWEDANKWHTYFSRMREEAMELGIGKDEALVLPEGMENLHRHVEWLDHALVQLRAAMPLAGRAIERGGGTEVGTQTLPPPSPPPEEAKKTSEVGTDPPWVPPVLRRDRGVGPKLHFRSRGVETPREWWKGECVCTSHAAENRGSSPALTNNAAPPTSQHGRESVDGTPRSTLRGSAPTGLSYADKVKAPRTRGLRSQRLVLAPGLGDVRVARNDDGDLVVEIPTAMETGVEAPPPRRGDSGVESSSGEGGRSSPEEGRRRRRRQGWRRVGRPSAVLPIEWPARCYSCLEAGHVAAQCPGSGSSRGGRCYKCGAPSHKMASCRAGTPRCPLCADLGLPARHVLGAEGCRPPLLGGERSGRSGGAPLSPGAGRGLPPSKIGGRRGRKRDPPDPYPEGWDPGGGRGRPRRGRSLLWVSSSL